MTRKNAVAVDNLSFLFEGAEELSLRNISFEIEEGTFVSIIGHNGAGKSTLCHALVGLIPHYFVGDMGGSVVVKDRNTVDSSVTELSEVASLVFQNPYNQLTYTAETVAEELAFGLTTRGVSRAEMLQRVHDVAIQMRIENLLDRNPLELSGGQIQRVAFGSAYILMPEILILDEATTQLDPMGADEIVSIAKKLNASGKTVIMVDNDLERVSRLADRVLVLNQGSLIADGTPRRIFAEYDQSELGLDTLDYVAISRGLNELTGDGQMLATTEEEATAQVKKALR
ncbi:energy-coupling factor ABC transporter ATP-binding protein [Corynebacterium glucuronolyticum]|uniref:energy-coupling factor ABC transporter ATP-binding protein n=1 Tax=Corynebacterium glucuronolyticum TaxID=39791 RepID=UPI00019C1AD1|nr:ATP-binding cassette domain-containing protein [Corynebacterium glucuronolyticum]EEI27852.1 ABC transporter, ATP-binding protein [Corynebacterium glucuronolyticum ATCC 51867]QRO82103.1 ATP-binding cassette domain-containing protein [Corynebacterium glucuronolyticum]